MHLLALLARLAVATGGGAFCADLPAVSTSAEANFVSPSTESYSQTNGTIQLIDIHRKNVFDLSVPGEDWWIFKLANRIHIMTKEHVVRRELLFDKGDRWNALNALESERNLRASGFIRTAEIRPSPKPPLELDVYTQDTWTLAPQLNVGTEGGEHYLIYGIEESNLLGYGKSIGVFRGQSGPRSRSDLRYADPRLLGSRVKLTTLFARTNNGDEAGVSTARPFYSLNSPYGWNATWARVVQEDLLFQDAEQTSKFLQDFRSVNSQAGAKLPVDSEIVQRVSIGQRYERSRFSSMNDTHGPIPDTRALSGPVIGYELVQPSFIKETYIDRMERVEDYNLGNEFSVRGGAMMTSLGSDADRWTLNAQDQQGFRIAPGRFLLGQAGVRGRMRHNTPENTLFYGNLNLFWKTFTGLPQTLVAHLEGNTTRNLDEENQLVLGGSTGLRGYRNNSFTGVRSALLNLEDRVFWPEEFFHLFYVGGVIFYETGAIMPAGGALTWSSYKSDVGLGFRLGPTRSASGSVLRIDLAYAINHGPGSQRWVVSVRGGQAFQIFNSTIKNVIRTPAAAVSENSAGDRLRSK